MKIVTWNVNSLRLRLETLLTLIEEVSPDVIALQEIKMVNDQFPYEALQKVGYYAQVSGQKTFNGVALLTREMPGEQVVTEFPHFPDEQRRILALTWNGYRIVNFYIPNGAELSSPKYQYKLQWLDACHTFLAQEILTHENLIVVGDFNIAPSDLDVWNSNVWHDCVLVSKPERQAFTRLTELGLKDLFRELYPNETLFSWWDYRAGAYRQNHGLRIDHILASEPLLERCKKVSITKGVRGLLRPSDHAPVIAEFE